MIDKNHYKYLVQMKLMAPQLKALIKIHKEDKSTRPVINNIPALSYKLAKYIIKKLNPLIQLQYTYLQSPYTHVFL
jgi:thermostable 8-oxoguanine DNA glycosylase